MKKVLSFALLCCMLLSLLPATAFASDATSGVCGASGNNITWTMDTATGTLGIYGTGRMADYTAENQPWHAFIPSITNLDIGGPDVSHSDEVTYIGTHAFDGCIGLTRFDSGFCSKEIGAYAFSGCTGLKEIGIFGTIDDYAFSGCTSLSTAGLSKCSNIGQYAFNGCANLKEVTIGEPFKVSANAFCGCTCLKYLSFGYSGEESVSNTIGSSAFSSCVSLKDVYFYGKPSSVTAAQQSDRSFPSDAVIHYSSSNASEWNSVISEGKWCGYTAQVISETEKKYSGMCGYDVEWSFDEESGKLTLSGSGKTYEYLGEGEFPEWYIFDSDINSVDIGSCITSIGAGIFSGLSNLTQVVIPASVKEIQEYAFSECRNMNTVLFLGDAPAVHGDSKTYEEAFFDSTTLLYISGKNGWTPTTYHGYTSAAVTAAYGLNTIASASLADNTLTLNLFAYNNASSGIAGCSLLAAAFDQNGKMLSAKTIDGLSITSMDADGGTVTLSVPAGSTAVNWKVVAAGSASLSPLNELYRGTASAAASS